MKMTTGLFAALFALAFFPAPADDRIDSVTLGNTEVFRDYRVTDRGSAILTLNAVVTETNNSLRGLKNSDRRRLKNLGQLIYQCKLMLYNPDRGQSAVSAKDPVLISKNYSLFTGVDEPLAPDERVGIQARALPAVDVKSLFAPTFGGKQAAEATWQTLGGNAALNLKQFDINLLGETDLIETSESIDFTIRFPVFQVKKPVNQWNYSFDLKDFKRAQQYIDQNCTPVRLVELINRNG